MGELSLPFPLAARDRIARRVRRIIRKHSLAFISVGSLLGIIFFPTLFMGRVLSPNDVYFHYQPWASMANVEAQNPLIHDPPTSYITLVSLLKNDPSSFHWNRYIGSGIPGFGSVAAAVVSPFIAIPALLLPLIAVYSGIIIVKIVFSFVTAYYWLREERLGKVGATAGAIVFAGAGVYAVWWLWQGTNATSLYAITLYFLARAFHGKRNPTWAIVLVLLLYLLSGFPAPVAYGVYLAAAYIAYKSIALRRFPTIEIGKFGLGAVLALLIASPLLHPFLTFLRKTGYLERRAETSFIFFYPREHLKAFIDPYRLGDPASHRWVGSQELAISDNFVEATIYVGVITLILALAGLLRKRAWFWAVFAGLLILLMFVPTPLSKVAAALPGLKYSPLPRLRVLLPIPFAFLAASGVAVMIAVARRSGRPQWIARKAVCCLVLLAGADLALFASRFHPYVRPEIARIGTTPLVRFLQEEEGPFRIAPFFNMFFPNTAELIRVEDIRAHWGSEQKYRELLLRVDPSSGALSTVIMLHSLKANLSDPLLGFLNVRYLYEGGVDVLRWSIYGGTEPAERAEQQPLILRPGQTLRRTVTIDAVPFYALELDALLLRAQRDAALTVRIRRPETNEVVFARTYSAGELQKMPKLYLPMVKHVQLGNALVTEVESRGMRVQLVRGPERFGESPLTFGRLKTPVVQSHIFPEGPVYQNLAELPRWFAVWDLEPISREEFLQRIDIDLGRVAVVNAPADALAAKLAAIPHSLRHATFRPRRYSGSEQIIETVSKVPFLMATSEKLTSELRVEVDGERVAPIEINSMFAGVPVEKGTHTIRLSRRIGGGWWWASLFGIVGTLGSIFVERRLIA